MTWFKCVGPVEGGGGSSVIIKEYCKVSPDSGIMLPVEIKQSTDKLEFWLYHKVLKTYDGIIGYTGGPSNSNNYVPLWINNNSRFTIYGYQTASYSITEGAHKIEFNPTDNSVTIDDVEIATGITITSLGDSKAYYVLGSRYIDAASQSATAYNGGYIGRFKVTDTATGNIRCDYKPAIRAGVSGFYDSVSDAFVTAPRTFSLDLSAGKKVRYVTKSTGGDDASITLELYENNVLVNSQDILYTTVPNEQSAVSVGCIKIWYSGKWYIKAVKQCVHFVSQTGIPYYDGDAIINWTYNSSVDNNLYFDD